MKEKKKTGPHSLSSSLPTRCTIEAVFDSKSHDILIILGKIRCSIVWDKHSTVPVDIAYLLFWAQRNCWWQSGVYQSWSNLKNPAPIELDNTFPGGLQCAETLPVTLGCEVCLNKEEEKVQKHPLVLCNWLLILKQE